MNKLILYTDLDGNELVMLCTSQEFYDGVFEGDDAVTIEAEIDIDADLTVFPTDRPLTANF